MQRGATGITILIACFLPELLTAAPVELKQSKAKIDVLIGGQPFTTYYFNDAVAKPYLMPLRTASGIIISRDFPLGNSVTAADEKTASFEPHQRPLYFGHGNIDGLNFWAEKAFEKYYGDESREAYGRASFVRLKRATGGAESGSFQAIFNLLTPSNRVIGQETQTFEFSGDNDTRTVDCKIMVFANEGPITFGDTKEGSFAIRLGPALSAPNNHMINSHGAEGEAAIWGKPADWVDYSGVIGGKKVGVVVFDSPRSFRHPTTWHARAYGLLAANPFAWREFTKDPDKDGSWTIPEGKSITFQYRVLIYEGQLSVAQLAAHYRAYSEAQ